MPSRFEAPDPSSEEESSEGKSTEKETMSEVPSDNAPPRVGSESIENGILSERLKDDQSREGSSEQQRAEISGTEIHSYPDEHVGLGIGGDDQDLEEAGGALGTDNSKDGYEPNDPVCGPQ